MLKTLFWNIRQRPLLNLVGELVREHSVDVVVLAECRESPEVVQEALQSSCDRRFFIPDARPSRLVVVSGLGGDQFREVDLDLTGMMSIRCTTFGGMEFLWAFVHLGSKLFMESEDQTGLAREVSSRLRQIEARRGHGRTILCGDFNMNPFERGLVEAGAFHAMMTQDSVRRGHRTVVTQEFPFFYNPMWGLFGDRTAGPPGTYYSRRSSHLSYDWNLFDQVLFRKDVLPYVEDDPQIPTSAGSQSLVNKRGRPDKKNFSDHLPLLFTLGLN